MNFLINLSNTNKLVLFPIRDHNNNLVNQTKRDDDSIDPNAKRLTSRLIPCAAKSGGIPPISVFKKCDTCRGKGAIDCLGCKGTGRNKKNGNIFERWKCFDCQGFGLKRCPECGTKGLTPEQRGER